MEHPKRTLIKTLTWRLIAFITTTVVIYIYTGDIRESLVVGISANLIKMFLYYGHERLWNRIDFGRIKQQDYQI